MTPPLSELFSAYKNLKNDTSCLVLAENLPPSIYRQKGNLRIPKISRLTTTIERALQVGGETEVKARPSSLILGKQSK